MPPCFLVSDRFDGDINPTSSWEEVCGPVGTVDQIISELGNSVKAFPNPMVAVFRHRACSSMQNQ
jgi:hypothetical protein